MLIYALTGQVWTIQFIRAVTTILFWKTEPMEDSRVGDSTIRNNKTNTEQNQQHNNKRQESMVKTHKQEHMPRDWWPNMHSKLWKWKARSCHCTQGHWRRRGENEEHKLTIITTPVDVDAASIVAGELGERETCGVGCGQNKELKHVAYNA